jgi:activator of HSP90 ATPase
MAKNTAVKTKSIKQVVIFKASPEEVYETLMDSKRHSAFSGGKAKISRKAGGTFNAYDGWIEGKNVKIVPNKIIVQKWRGEDWPKAHYSVATFKLEKKGTGTKLTFTQKDVPLDKVKDITSGWKEHYWNKMKIYLNE